MLLRQVQKFARCENGSVAIEYGLLAALLAVVIIAGLTVTGDALILMYDVIATTVTESMADAWGG